MSERSASIDDLLGHEEEQPSRPEREASATGWWVRTALIAAALAAVTVFGLRLFGIAVSIPVVLAIFFALLALRRVTSLVAPPPPPRPRPRARALRGFDIEDGRYNWAVEDGLRVAIDRWERRLGRAQKDVGQFTGTTQPALAELVDERLRQRYGFTRATDPARAQALLGDAVWTLLTTPTARTLTPRQCAALVGQLEKL